VLGVLVEREGGMRLLAANLTDHPTRLRLPIAVGLVSRSHTRRPLGAAGRRSTPLAFRNQAEIAAR
jgi:hypothetical protein